MEIRTKFNIEDSVWVLDYNIENRKYFVRAFLKIKTISIRNTIIEDNDLYYQMDCFDERQYREQDCFATKEEAQKECDRRNGNKGTED